MAKNMYIPSPDMLLVASEAKKLRGNITNFLPNIGLSMIDYGRCHDIDRFYLNCQEFRDWYKDDSGKLRKLEEFDMPPKHYASRPDPTSVYVRQPIRYKIEPRPVFYPLTEERQGRPRNDTMQINLTGRYYERPCIKYKR